LIRIDNSHLLPGQLVLAGPDDRVRGLAALDEVAYILPASADLVAGNAVAGCAGPLLEEQSLAEYAKVGRGWPLAGNEAAIGYAVAFTGSKLPESTVRSEIARALAEWEKYARLRFTPAADVAADRTIAIRFATGSHGDTKWAMLSAWVIRIGRAR
jgi:hypothetical protein